MDYKTKTGYNLKLTPTSNIAIFVEISKSKLIVPRPPLYTDDEGRTLENPFHPLYHNALTVYDLQRHQLAFDAIVSLCVTLKTTVDTSDYIEAFDAIKASNLISTTETLQNWFIKNYILSDDDVQYIVSNTLLTENKVAGIFNSIRVTRDGYDIHQTAIKNAITTNIETDPIVIAGYQLVSPLDEIKSAQFSMMNWSQWTRCEISLEEKATAVALYRLDRVVETHSNDVVQIHQERESRKKTK